MASATIKVRNFPPEFLDEHIEVFLKFFGAKDIKILTSKANWSIRSIAYAKFESQEFAEAVIKRLHQKDVMGYRLTVELSPYDLDVNLMKCPDPPKTECNADEVKKLHDEYLKKLNGWTTALDLNQPPPHNLRYSYPDLNPHILSKIASALACHQKFYYQVLHLMNRMNLPAPFEPVEECSLINFIKTETADKNTTTDETDPELSESEMESEDESEHIIDNVEPKLSSTRKKIYKGMKSNKRLKVVTGTVQKKPKVELAKVFDTVECETPKKIEVKVSAELKPAEGPSVSTEGGFGVIYSTNSRTQEESKNESESDDDLSGDCISKEQLATNRLSEKDMKDMPIFKNYHPGAPSCRLYIKNLAKVVTDSDLKFIFMRFIKSGDLKPGTMFDVRLMQEGRMKGQAFITLPSVENAQQALKETNGYILKDKPMIVQFARSATAK